MSKAARAALSHFSGCASSEDDIPFAFTTEPTVAWRVDSGKRVHTNQPGFVEAVEAVPIRDAVEELDELESDDFPDLPQDVGVLEGKAITRSPITLQPSSTVFDSKMTEDCKHLALAVTHELHDLSTSVNNLALARSEAFEIPAFTHGSAPEDHYLLDFNSSSMGLAEDATKRDRARSYSMCSDDWPILQGLDAGSMDSLFTDGQQKPPIPVTMER
jgi:hypothetical protein